MNEEQDEYTEYVLQEIAQEYAKALPVSDYPYIGANSHNDCLPFFASMEAK